jgi:hypothetical protein
MMINLTIVSKRYVHLEVTETTPKLNLKRASAGRAFIVIYFSFYKNQVLFCPRELHKGPV